MKSVVPVVLLLALAPYPAVAQRAELALGVSVLKSEDYYRAYGEDPTRTGAGVVIGISNRGTRWTQFGVSLRVDRTPASSVARLSESAQPLPQTVWGYAVGPTWRSPAAGIFRVSAGIEAGQVWRHAAKGHEQQLGGGDYEAHAVTATRIGASAEHGGLRLSALVVNARVRHVFQSTLLAPDGIGNRPLYGTEGRRQVSLEFAKLLPVGRQR